MDIVLTKPTIPAKARSMDLPKANFFNAYTYLCLDFWIIFLNGNSHPYILIDLIHYIISVVFWTL